MAASVEAIACDSGVMAMKLVMAECSLDCDGQLVMIIFLILIFFVQWLILW